MNNLQELKQALVDYLTPRFAPDAQVVDEYPQTARPACPSTPMVGVGIHQVQAVSAGASPYLGAAEGQEQFGRGLDITLRFTILSPDNAGDCHRLFTTLCQALLLESCPLPVSGLSCDELRYDRALGGFVLTARAGLPALFATGGEGREISEFIIRSVKP